MGFMLYYKQNLLDYSSLHVPHKEEPRTLKEESMLFGGKVVLPRGSSSVHLTLQSAKIFYLGTCRPRSYQSPQQALLLQCSSIPSKFSSSLSQPWPHMLEAYVLSPSPKHPSEHSLPPVSSLAQFGPKASQEATHTMTGSEPNVWQPPDS